MNIEKELASIHKTASRALEPLGRMLVKKKYKKDTAKNSLAILKRAVTQLEDLIVGVSDK